MTDNHHQNKVFALISKALNGVQDEPLTKERQEWVETAAFCVQKLCLDFEKEDTHES